MNIFKTRFGSTIPLLSFFILAALYKFSDKLGEHYLMVSGITLLVLFLANMGLVYTRYKEGRVVKSKIILAGLIMAAALGIWAYYLFFP
jgi:hypothetical protein